MDYLKSLFERAKNTLMSGVYNTTKSFKQKIGKFVVNEFGPDVINAGAELLETKATEAVKQIVEEYSPLKIINSFLKSPSPTNLASLNEQFTELLKEAEAKLNEYAAQHPDPLSQSGIINGRKLLKKLQQVQHEFFKLHNKSAKQFKQMGEETIKQMQPILEEELTKHFAALILIPFINFFKDILLSLFQPQQNTAKNSTDTKASAFEQNNSSPVNNKEQSCHYEEEPHAPSCASL